MDQYGKVIRIGGLVVACALILRLGSLGYFEPVARVLTSRTVAAVVLFLETGHVLRPVSLEEPTQPETTEAPETAPLETTVATQPTVEQTVPPEPAGAVAVFGPSDASLVQVQSFCGYEADVPTWLEKPLQWDLQQEGPTVLILHSHATESYENTENYQESSRYRTRDENYNVVSVGDALVQHLEVRGISALHDRRLHDYPSYSDAYNNSRTAAREHLEQYPSIQLVLDLHRDSVTDASGNQVRYTVETARGTAARLMLVVGTDAGGLSHASWPENMSLAVKFHAQLEKLCPGICRPISFRSQRFNQDLSAGALLIEVGSAGNTRQEAMGAVEVLADAIAALAQGTQ